MNDDHAMTIEVEGGQVRMYDWMHIPPELKSVNVARSSFAKTKEVFEASDEKFLKWLADEIHTSPFRHSPITLHVRCPEFIARQWYKHIVGCEYSFKDTGWNEVSGRYIRYGSTYIPDELHVQAKTKKQGASPDVHEKSDMYLGEWKILSDSMMDLYNRMIDDRVANEEARIILPMGLYTEFHWTASTQALRHFVSLRTAKDAQGLIQQYASAVDVICKHHYGVLWDAMESLK